MPKDLWRSPSEKVYAAVVARALRKQFGGTHGATKRVMRWTGASERAVKNWFAGSKGPSGMHLISLIRNSDAVFEAFLDLAQRDPYLVSHNLHDARKKLLEILRSLGPDQSGETL
ncbi:MAG TPA: hypothetical protein VFI23_19675 [Rhizomicrobium sp.]|nr:hypothetical protein [Rhizomicrobium sp.]